MGSPQKRRQKEPAYDLYAQVLCARCGRAVYLDEARYLDTLDALCRDCHVLLTTPLKPPIWRVDQYRVPIIGLSFLELLGVALILGLVILVVASPIARLKERADESALQLLLLQNENPEITAMALSITTSENKAELDRLVWSAAQLAGVSRDELAAFQADLMKYRVYDSQEVQAGAIIRTIEEWRSTLERGPDSLQPLAPK